MTRRLYRGGWMCFAGKIASAVVLMWSCIGALYGDDTQKVMSTKMAESRTQRMFSSRWGVFHHFLAYECKSSAAWNAKVDALDVDKLADRLASCGVGFCVFTLMQNTRYMCAPNEAYAQLTGLKDTCARRDLPWELADALTKRGIDLYLYCTARGTCDDAEAGEKQGYSSCVQDKVTDAFVQNWGKVLEEYATRYGERVKGWWIDMCFADVGYTQARMKVLAEAIWRGNEKALIGMSGGQKPYFTKCYEHEDFIFGECDDFFLIPRERFIDGAQSAVLAPLGAAPGGGGWTLGGCQHDGAYLADFVNLVNRNGGVVVLDVKLNGDGSLDDDQVQVLKAIGRKTGRVH